MIELLERESTELLVIVVGFLKRLSIFTENKNQMKDADIVKNLAPLLLTENENLTVVVLMLLLNLSFDRDLRTRMVELGLLRSIVDFLPNQQMPTTVLLQILYHISLDDSNKHQFASTNCLAIMMRMILQSKGDRVELEVMALMVNLASDQKCAAAICQNNGLRQVLKCFFRHLIKSLVHVAGQMKVLLY